MKAAEITQLRKTLESSIEYYSSLFDHHPDAIYTVNRDGVFLSGNPACERMTGYMCDQKLTFRDVIVPEDLEHTLCYFQEALKGRSQEYGVRVLCKDSTVKDMQVINIPIWVGGEVVGAYGIARDITENNRENQKLRDQEVFLSRVQKMAHVGGWEWDVQSNRIVGSMEFYRLWDIPCGRHELKMFYNRIAPEDLERVQTAMCGASKGLAYNIEFRAVLPNGQQRIFHVIAEPEVTCNGVTRVLGTTHDITELRMTKDALKRSESRYQLMAENMSDLLAILDTEGKIEYCSPSYLTTLGYRPSYYEGKSCFPFLHPDDAPVVAERFAQMLEDRTVMEAFYRAKHRDGEWVMLEGRLVPTLDAEGRVDKIIVVSRDITERKRTEEKMIQNEKLSMAGQFAAAVAHEIRNPLTSLNGFAKLLKQSADEQETRYLEIMESELERIELILSELLLLAKPQKQVIRSANVGQIVQEVTSLMYPQALISNVEIVQEVEDGVPDIPCDSNEMKQAFLNFMKNAIESMPDGGQVRVMCGYSHERGIVVRIEDQGVGIPPEQLKRIGEPFYTTKSKGTGLGMMISRKIIESYGGEMRVSSEVGKGTVVETRFLRNRTML